ncbi:MAG: GNAT family N-acetyltransferase [Gemmataceae bacterium]
MPKLDLLSALTATDRDALVAPLDSFSREQGFPWQPNAIALALRDDAGTVVGGLIGQLLWGWLRIEILAVPTELRGQGWGRRLVEEAERLAIAAGCHSAWVDTFSFQSPGFYHRLGYSEFGRLADYPLGQTRHFLSRRLVPTEQRPAD